MGFKKSDHKLTFAELALTSSMEKNRSLDTLMNMNEIIDWSKIESILLNYYKIGISNEGADAYPPLMLFKALLLQKWFRPSTIFRTYGASINSDPELENQIYPVK